MAHFIVVLALLQQSGTEHTIYLRHACILFLVISKSFLTLLPALFVILMILYVFILGSQYIFVSLHV